MKSAIFALLVASTSAIRMNESPFVQTPTPTVIAGMGGMAGPRVCEMGANTNDTGHGGCLPQTNYTVPVSSGKLANPSPPIGGVQHNKEAEGPNATPRAGRGGMVYIPFAYSQKNSMQMTQVSDPSLSDQEEANYQKVYDAEQTRLKAANKALKDTIVSEEAVKTDSDVDYRKAHSDGLAPLISKGTGVVHAQKSSMQMTQVSDPSLSDQEEANYQKVYDAEQTRLKAANKELKDTIIAEEKVKTDSDVEYRAAHSKGLAPLIAKGIGIGGGK